MTKHKDTAIICGIFIIDENIFGIYNKRQGGLGECVPGRMPIPMHRVRGPPHLFKEEMEMEIDSIIQLIGSLGFPIVACGALFWMLNKQTEMHRSEMETIKEAIDELKVAILQLTNLLNNRQI